VPRSHQVDFGIANYFDNQLNIGRETDGTAQHVCNDEDVVQVDRFPQCSIVISNYVTVIPEEIQARTTIIHLIVT